MPAAAGDGHRTEKGAGAARAARLGRELGVPAELLAGLSPELARRFEERLLELRDAAAVDELTGALRRAAGRAALERELRRARRHGDHRLVVAFLDLDGLKSVNDRRGHAAGDSVLQELAAALRRRLRAYDLVVRWGGDEFLAVLSHAGREAAERALVEVHDDFSARTGETFTAGFAEIGADGDPESLVTRADADLYARKRGRRDRWGESRQKRHGRSLHTPA